MALVDIFVLDFKQRFGSEEIHNIFTFDRLEDGSAPIDLIEAFVEDVVPAINFLQTDDIQNVSATAYSLGDDDLIDERVVEGGGGSVQDMLPLFNALNFTLKPTTRAIRPGSKRISGIPENVSTNGTITDVDYIAGMEDLRDVFGTNISNDDTNFWAFVVVKRVKYVPDPERPDHFAYRFPETDLELVYAPLRAVLTNTKVSHQVSRGN